MTDKQLMELVKQHQIYDGTRWVLSANNIIEHDINIEWLQKRGWQQSPGEDLMYYDRGF